MECMKANKQLQTFAWLIPSFFQWEETSECGCFPLTRKRNIGTKYSSIMPLWYHQVQIWSCPKVASHHRVELWTPWWRRAKHINKYKSVSPSVKPKLNHHPSSLFSSCSLDSSVALAAGVSLVRTDRELQQDAASQNKARMTTTRPCAIPPPYHDDVNKPLEGEHERLESGRPIQRRSVCLARGRTRGFLMTFAFYCWSVVGSLAPTVCGVEFWFGCRGAVDAMAIMGASWV